MLPVSNFMEIRPVGSVLREADRRTEGWTEMTKVTGTIGE